MNRYEQMRAFLETVEAGSFTQAAARLDVAKSAVSRRVAELEARLGTQLLARTTRSVTPTPEGLALAERARVLLADWEEAEGEVRARAGALSGPIRMSVPLSFGLARLAPTLTAFARAHPGVELDLDVSDRTADLVGEGFDLAVRLGERLPDSSLRMRRMDRHEIWAAASPALLDAYGTPRTPAELARLPELRYGLRPATSWTLTRPGHADATIEMPCAHRLTNGEMTVEFARAGLGVAVEPEFIIGPAVADGSLLRLLPDWSFPGVDAHVVYPETRRLSRRVRALVDFVVEGCG